MKKILIVGGGIAGVSLANFLDKQKFEITLVEQAQEWKPVGYVIGLWYNGIKILQKHGIYDGLVGKGVINTFQQTTNQKGSVLKEVSFERLNKKFGVGVQFMHRATLHEALLSKMKDVNVMLGTTVTDLAQGNDAAEMTFSDGKKNIFDVVIGADGVKSKTRSFIFPDYQPFTYPVEFFSFLTDAPLPTPAGNIEMFGKGNFFGIYPYSSNSCGVYCAIQHNPHTTLRENMLERLRTAFQNFGGYVPSILEKLNVSTSIVNDLVREVDMKAWHKGNVLLIGDASHALLPTTGQGVAAAIEDASVLATMLNSPYHSLEQTYQNFTQMRKIKLAGIRSQSRMVHKFMMSPSPLIAALRNLAVRFSPFDTVSKLESFFDED
jgi:2-polyprenyl-6-methoxyphenol hydroxylase-like FAD-dependent oxidoreductase